MAPDQESSVNHIEKPVESIAFDLPASEIENDSHIKPLTNGAQNGISTSGNGSSEYEETDIPNSNVQLSPPSQVRLEWQRIQKVGAGLANLGNTCFLNTVIQCLTYCPPLTNYLMLSDHGESCKCYEFCMMCELQKHIKEALQHSGDVIKPVHIYENLKFIADHFQCGQQEDAHEFLRFVIENLWRSSLYSYNDNESLDPIVRETTIINHIFGGYNRSQVMCLRCHKKSNKYEHFMDFILDIKYNANTLEKALALFVKPEILENDNAYKCPRCDKLVPAEKTSAIHKAPNVATIQLKRFDYSKSHGGKINKHVSYPELLDLRPYMSEKTGHPLMYKLNAVLVHVGQNCTSGHYYCYIRNSNGHWYLMDDARVQKVGLHDVLNQQAYVLFYVRVPATNCFKRKGMSSFPVQSKNGLDDCGKDDCLKSHSSGSYSSQRSYSNYANNRRHFRSYSEGRRNNYPWNNREQNGLSSKANYSRYNSSGASSENSSEHSEGSDQRVPDGDFNLEKEDFHITNTRTNFNNANGLNYSGSNSLQDSSQFINGHARTVTETFISRNQFERNAYEQPTGDPESYGYRNGQWRNYNENIYFQNNGSQFQRTEYWDNQRRKKSFGNQYFYDERLRSVGNGLGRRFSDNVHYEDRYCGYPHWNNRNVRENNRQFCVENKKPNYRKFHAKSKSVDSFSFGHQRYNPYRRWYN